MKVSEHLDQTWNLDVFFAGGSDSPAFAAFLDNLVASVRALEERVRAATVAQTLDEARVWSQLLQTAQEIDTHLSQALAFAGCLSAQDMHDEKSRILLGQVRQIRANHANIWSLLEHQILQMPDQVWQALLADEQWTLVSYRLQEMRRLAKEKLPSEQEALVNDLSVDGYHSWREMYESIVGRIAVPFERNGQTVRLSAGQLFNLFYSSDHAMRRAAAVKWEQAWDEVAPLCAEVLNHLAGFRLNLYRHRGWTSVLREPLANNRIREETLRTMWDVVEQNKAPYVAYMQRKARLFGLDALTWYDQHAPV